MPQAETTEDLIAQMAMLLRVQRVDLADERRVLVALQAGRFKSGDVVALSDAAIAKAREWRL